MSVELASGRAPVDWPPMGPRDRPLMLPDGAACTACGAAVPAGRIRILARRDDVAFVELACSGCGSAAVGLLIPEPGPGGESFLDVAADTPSSLRASDRATVRRITTADVAAIRDDLAAWQGDLVGWLEALDEAGPPGTVVDR
jgi:hypothetical protein